MKKRINYFLLAFFAICLSFTISTEAKMVCKYGSGSKKNSTIKWTYKTIAAQNTTVSTGASQVSMKRKSKYRAVVQVKKFDIWTMKWYWKKYNGPWKKNSGVSFATGSAIAPETVKNCYEY